MFVNPKSLLVICGQLLSDKATSRDAYASKNHGTNAEGCVLKLSIVSCKLLPTLFWPNLKARFVGSTLTITPT